MAYKALLLENESVLPIMITVTATIPSPIRSSARHSSPIVDDHDTEVNDLRRQVLALTNAKKPSEDGKKRKRVPKGSEPTPLQQGRAIPRRVTVFDDLHTIQSQYDAYRRNGFHKPPNDDDDDIDELEEGPSEEERAEKRNMERGYTAIKEMEHVMPNFIKRVGEEGGQALILELERGADSAKTHDTQAATKIIGQELNRRVRRVNEARIKEHEEEIRRVQTETEAVLKEHAAQRENSSTDHSHDTVIPLPLPPLPAPPLVLLPEFDEGSRNNRGLENDMTGGLLCPGEIDWKDHITRTAVQRMDPEYDFASSAHSLCFYKDEKFDLDDPDNGFLQSHWLLQTYRTIFTSPSSAKGQSDDVENLPPSKKRTTSNSHRAHVANIIHMTEVTPRSIAYAAVHLHIALTDASHWTHSYNGYNYQDLWNFVVDFFEDPIDEEAEKQGKKLLKWWTDRIFTGTGSAANSRGTKMVSRRQVVVKKQTISSSPVSPLSPAPLLSTA
ncbi:hypothetical protein C8R41DRAFT_867087 [Lentinula lateritia]|uniref:Uncharacterized protein n=1 Tax=Lentinula lateritia TaxID=40482 RepID=A0ABQ8VG18_9AGAR|nr:hypothetical protein C8R41DRAFT_867087 [Lentinula lateritia]